MTDRAPRRGDRPRIEDVAALAGTAAITVSRALRQPAQVAPATRARILAAVERLGYIPDLSASSLASRRSGIIAVLVPTIANAIFAETVQGVADAVGSAGLQILLGDYSYSDSRERDLLHAIAGRRPDAIVVVGLVREPAQRKLLRKLGLPVVETWDLTDDPIDMVVGFSNGVAGATMARHLLARGRCRLAFSGGADQRAQARAAGFTAVLQEAGVATPLLDRVETISIAEGRRALRRILAQAPDRDGIFMGTDVLAVGALLECQERGIAVPGQIAIAGLGDLEIGRELVPALTTINVGAHEIGRRAGLAVLARLAGKPAGPRVLDVGFSVISRAST